MVKYVVRTALGLAAMIAWWTLTGDSVDTPTASEIPTQVWDGGAGTLSVDLDTTTPAQVRIGFDENSDEDSARSLNTWQDIPAGHHSFTIDVPSDVGGYVELGAVEPKVGDSLSWTISAGGRVVDEQSQTLDEPLQDGWAFALQTYFDDYATGTIGED